MLGSFDILCGGVLYLLVLGCRLHSVWDVPIFLGLRLFLLRKVHDVFWGLLIPSVLYFLVVGFRPKISVFMTTGDVEPKRSTDSLLLSEAR